MNENIKEILNQYGRVSEEFLEKVKKVNNKNSEGGEEFKDDDQSN